MSNVELNKSETNVESEDISCPICEKKVSDLYTAINYKDSGKPAHFECVIIKISQEEQLKTDEKVIYIGNGVFGVLRMKNQIGNPGFEIIKKIPIETSDNRIGWRKKLANHISYK